MTAQEQADRRREVREAINTITDPCSMAAATPTGIADLGLVEEIGLNPGGGVQVLLMTTAPHCMYVGHFQQEIEDRVKCIEWVDSVSVSMTYDTIWDESRMESAARERLHAQHRRPLEASRPPRRRREVSR